jgi:hypothetical protein
LREKIIGDTGEAKVIVEAAEAGRDTGLTGEIGGEWVGPDGTLLDTAVRVIYAGRVEVYIIATATGIDAVGILSVKVT